MSNPKDYSSTSSDVPRTDKHLYETDTGENVVLQSTEVQWLKAAILERDAEIERLREGLEDILNSRPAVTHQSTKWERSYRKRVRKIAADALEASGS